MPLWVKTKIVALILIACFGIPWAITMALPFSLVAQVANEKENGLYMGKKELGSFMFD